MTSAAHISMLTRDQALAALRAGQVIALPTDTVCGIAVSVDACDSPAQLFEAKGRPDAKPVAWLVANAQALDAYGDLAPDSYAHTLAQQCWPGELTIIVKASDQVPAAYASQQGSIGLRMTAVPELCTFIEELGCPLACTSANLSGEPAAARIADIDPVLAQRIAGAVDFETASEQSGSGSTVVDCTGAEPIILREGSVSSQLIHELVP